jgi:hypothetical protein
MAGGSVVIDRPPLALDKRLTALGESHKAIPDPAVLRGGEV